MVSISEDVLNELVKSNDPVIYKNSIPLPRNNFYLHQFIGNVPYCTINSSPDCVQIDFNDEIQLD